jgi:hypothetical protein
VVEPQAAARIVVARARVISPGRYLRMRCGMPAARRASLRSPEAPFVGRNGDSR